MFANITLLSPPNLVYITMFNQPIGLHIHLYQFDSMGRKRKEIDLNTYTGQVALRLRTVRELKGITVEEVAEKSGIPAPTIFGWESAKNSPPMEALPKLAKAMDVKIHNLVPEPIETDDSDQDDESDK